MDVRLRRHKIACERIAAESARRKSSSVKPGDSDGYTSSSSLEQVSVFRTWLRADPEASDQATVTAALAHAAAASGPGVTDHPQSTAKKKEEICKEEHKKEEGSKEKPKKKKSKTAKNK